MLKIGDIVSRNKYGNDIYFVIIDIKDDIYYLKGLNIRLYADSELSDLNKEEDNDERIDDDKILQMIDFKNEIRSDYFYIPGKILHIDADIHLNNKVAKPYKIRVLTKLGNHKKSLKRQKIGNFH